MTVLETLKKATRSLKAIMVGARTLEEPVTLESAKARLALIGQVAQEAIEEIEEKS